MNFRSLVVRAVDVGYGHIKFSDGRNPADQSLRTDSFPSQSPAARSINDHFGSLILAKRDTFIVPIGERTPPVDHTSLQRHGLVAGGVLQDAIIAAAEGCRGH